MAVLPERHNQDLLFVSTKMASRRVTIRPRRILVLGALLLCLLRLQQSFVDDIELHVPTTSVSCMQTVPLSYTRYAFLTRPRLTYSHTRVHLLLLSFIS